MATTKKVARKKVTRKKTVKKTTVPLKSAKKTTKKTAKKAIKKFTKKRVIADRTQAQRTSFDEKLAAVEILHKKRKVVTSKETLLPSKIRLKKPSVRDRLSLSILSQNSFPVNIDALAIQTARFSGVVFVILGGIFALNFAQYVLGSNAILTQHARTMTAGVCDSYTGLEYNVCMSQQALTTSSDTSGALLASSSSRDEIQLASTSVVTTINPNILSINNTQPTVTFSFDQNPPLHDTVEININVDEADAVKVLLYKDSWNGFERSFDAVQTGKKDWSYNWNTADYPDANYLIKAKVYNAYETNGYIQNNSSYLEVNNNGDTTGTSTIIADTEPPATVQIVTAQPVDVQARIRVEVPDANGVRFSVTDSTGSVSYLSGSADETSAGSNVWVYDWDTSGYADDEYMVNTHVENKNSQKKYNAGTVHVKIQHTTTSSAGDGEVDNVENSGIVELNDKSTTVDQPPVVDLSFRDGQTLTGFAEMRIDTVTAQSVKVYAIPDGSAVSKYIGSATKIAPKVWILRYHTKSLPNGKYDFYPEVTNAYGTYSGDSVAVEVDNQLPFFTDKEESSQITDAVEKVIVIEDTISPKIQHDISVGDVDHEPKSITNSSSSVEFTQDQENQKQAQKLISNFSERIDYELKLFASAYRSENTDRIELANERIEDLKKEITAQTASLKNKDELIKQINIQIDSIVKKYTQSIDEVDTLIAQRVDRDVFKDSDKDGISDYDEVRIYKTDPLVADSDGDGFVDGAEVESGYDPTDAKREVAITYESPKERGVVRADVLRVDSVKALVEDPTDEVAQPDAIITGVALPNSYVTIYIFSTPVVVTVKTDEDGAWRYRFDKELEDGEHNVYVGVTDNAGKIVAKSEPFTFIKQAQAFAPIDAAVSGSAEIVDAESDNSLLSQYMMYLIVSISVVSIGLVLILLGLHLDTRGRRYPEVINEQE